MNGKPESPVGVYGNLCVISFYFHYLYRGLRSFDIVLPSPEVSGAASDGGSRKFQTLLLGQTETNDD